MELRAAMSIADPDEVGSIDITMRIDGLETNTKIVLQSVKKCHERATKVKFITT